MNFELYITDFITLASAHFIALLSPGVDFFIIISNSSKYGKISGILTAFGINLANLIYILQCFQFPYKMIRQYKFKLFLPSGSFVLSYFGIFL